MRWKELGKLNKMAKQKLWFQYRIHAETHHIWSENVQFQYKLHMRVHIVIFCLDRKQKIRCTAATSIIISSDSNRSSSSSSNNMKTRVSPHTTYIALIKRIIFGILHVHIAWLKRDKHKLITDQNEFYNRKYRGPMENAWKPIGYVRIYVICRNPTERAVIS